MGFFIDDLITDEARRIRVDFTQGGGIYGILAQDVVFTGSAHYTYEQTMATRAMAGISDIWNATKHVTNIGLSGLGKASTGTPESKLTTPLQTHVGWSEDSGSFGFHVSIMQLAGSAVTVDASMIGKALKAVLPKKGTGWHQTAPMGYEKGKGGNASVRIGKWFETSSDLVVTHVSSSAGRELDGDGNPLYLMIQMGFMQANPLDADFIAGWFR